MANKIYFLYSVILLLNINNIISFKYPLNNNLLSGEKGDSTVIEITSKEELDKYIMNNKYIISIFHADWCGHCKRFLPVFNEASKYSIVNKSWKFLSISCTSYRSICDSFSIEGYPTIKIFMNSKERKLSPSRDLELLLEFLIKVIDNPLKEIKDINSFYDNYGTFSPLIEYNNTEFIECVKNLANNEFLSEYYFGTIKKNENRIIFNFDNNTIKYDWDNNCKNVKTFLKNNKYPLISEATINLMRKMNKDGKRLIFIIFYNSNNEKIYNFITNELKNISKDNREIVFSYSPCDKKKDLSNYFKIELNKETEFQILIYDFHKEMNYRHKKSDTNIDFESLEKEIRNLVKNVNNISFSSQDKIKDFIYNHKILLISIFVIFVIGIIYMACICDVDSDEDINETALKEKIEKDIIKKQKLKKEEAEKSKVKEDKEKSKAKEVKEKTKPKIE